MLAVTAEHWILICQCVTAAATAAAAAAVAAGPHAAAPTTTTAAGTAVSDRGEGGRGAAAALQLHPLVHGGARHGAEERPVVDSLHLGQLPHQLVELGRFDSSGLC